MRHFTPRIITTDPHVGAFSSGSDTGRLLFKQLTCELFFQVQHLHSTSLLSFVEHIDRQTDDKKKWLAYTKVPLFVRARHGLLSRGSILKAIPLAGLSSELCSTFGVWVPRSRLLVVPVFVGATLFPSQNVLVPAF